MNTLVTCPDPTCAWYQRPMWGTQRLCPACNGRTVFHSRDEDST